MKRLLIAVSLFAISGTGLAQNFQTSPNNLLSTEGYQGAYIFGEWQAARMMFFDGEMRNSIMVMKEVALRHDNRFYNNNNGSSNSGQGRTWSNVTLDVSYGDHTKTSQMFSANPTSTPVRVFSASVAFPTMSGFPNSNPATWDLKFPFSSSWINNGTADIVLDFDFNGGVLANNGRWSTSWYQTYYTDAPNIGDRASGRYTIVGQGCLDSTQTTYRGQAAVFTNVYAPSYPTSSFQNKYQVSTRTRNTAPGKPVVHAVSLSGNKTGINFPGVSCEKVYIDLTNPFFLIFTSADTTRFAEARIDFPLIPYSKSIENTPFWVQGAWDDPSATGSKLKFTFAEETRLPPMPQILKRRMIYQTDGTKKYTSAVAAQGSLQSPFFQATHNPIFRYAQ